MVDRVYAQLCWLCDWFSALVATQVEATNAAAADEHIITAHGRVPE